MSREFERELYPLTVENARDDAMLEVSIIQGVLVSKIIKFSG